VLNWLYDDTIPAAVRQGKVIRFREADVMTALGEARRQRGNPLAQDSGGPPRNVVGGAGRGR
jgi:hypothetical protein